MFEEQTTLRLADYSVSADSVGKVAGKEPGQRGKRNQLEEL